MDILQHHQTGTDAKIPITVDMELMCELLQNMGKEKFEKIIKEDFESTQVYTICYKLPAI